MALESWTRPSGYRTARRPLPGSPASTLFPPPSARKTGKRIFLVAGFFLSLCWLGLAQGSSSPAQAQETLKPPKFDGQLIAQYSHEGRSRTIALKQEEVVKIPFWGENLDFYYGVKRDRKEERKPGALIVKVIYLYDSGKEDIKDWAKDTELYRNPFPNRQAILDSAIRRPYYEQYHKEEIDNLFLIHNFHATFPDKQKTDGTYQRKRKFLFSMEPQWNPEIRRQRAYLLYYSGVDDPGIWVDFDVGITRQMSHLLISVIDLGQPGADLVERWWQLSKEK